MTCNAEISKQLTLQASIISFLLLTSERCLEDHELVVQVQASMNSDSRFLFRKNYAKYEFFRNPLVFALSQTFLILLLKYVKPVRELHLGLKLLVTIL